MVLTAASYSFGGKLAAAHALLACAVYGLVILARDNIQLAALKWTIASGTLLVAAAVMALLGAQVAQLVSQLDAVARTDSLTGLASRRVLEERLSAERLGGGGVRRMAPRWTSADLMLAERLRGKVSTTSPSRLT